jgi:hypothetical protein
MRTALLVSNVPVTTMRDEQAVSGAALTFISYVVRRVESRFRESVIVDRVAALHV